MTTAEFYADKNGICGFCVSGHSTNDCDDEEGRLICASISSAAYMAANTVSDIIGDRMTASVEDGRMTVRVINPSEQTRTVLKGFRLHLQQLSEQYKQRITIITEV